MNESDLSLDTLMQETLALSEYLRASSVTQTVDPVPVHHIRQSDKQSGIQQNFFDSNFDDDYLFDLADSLCSEEMEAAPVTESVQEILEMPQPQMRVLPEGPGIIYKIDNGSSTFCVRGFSAINISEAFKEIKEQSSSKRIVLKLDKEMMNFDEVNFFETKSYELAEAIREQIVNRRFPHQEDAVCNISDPGYSWWMNILPSGFEIFFRSHGINRADKYIQLGPIGDGGVAALRMNQARTLLRSSFPISEFSCDEKSFTVTSTKPEHLSFISFRNIFLDGINNTEVENFPDNSVGRTLYYYFHELAIVRKFWIEVKSKLG
jgi:hypothetical protein